MNFENVPLDADVPPDSVDPALIAFYPMEANGPIDVIGGNDGMCFETSTGCPTSVAGVVGDARAFDGTHAYVVPHGPDFLLEQGFTISVFVRRDSGTTPLAKPQRTGPGAAFELVVIGSEVWYCTDGTPGDLGEECIQIAVTPSTDWRHYALTWDRDIKRLYIDGVERGSSPAAIVFDDRELLIGADAENGPALTTPFIGAIDELRIYKRALSSDEIAALAR